MRSETVLIVISSPLSPCGTPPLVAQDAGGGKGKNIMKVCPKCGGKNGFSYNLIMKTNRIGDWGLNDDEEVEVERFRDVKTVMCIDCGKRIDWNVAHGIETEVLSSPRWG